MTDLSKVSISQFDDGYIFSIIINNIFIFNNKGELQFRNILTNLSKISNTNLSNYINYMIKPHKIIGNNYYYLIGYILEGSLYLNYYQYNSVDKRIKELSNNEFNNHGNFSKYYILYNGLSCQFMKDEEEGEEIITCLYQAYLKNNNNNQSLIYSFFYIYEICIIINMAYTEFKWPFN